MLRMVVSLAIGWLLACAPAWAINKCVAANGDITYSQAPCPTDSRREGSLQSMGIAAPAPAAAQPSDSGSRMLRTLVMCEATGGPRWCDEDRKMVQQCTPPLRMATWKPPAECAGYMAERKRATAVMDNCRKAGSAAACSRVRCAGGDLAACPASR